MDILKLFRRITIGCLLFTASISAQAHINGYINQKNILCISIAVLFPLTILSIVIWNCHKKRKSKYNSNLSVSELFYNAKYKEKRLSQAEIGTYYALPDNHLKNEQNTEMDDALRSLKNEQQ